MYYNRHRYYDPEICQYISPDPIGMQGGLLPQAYVHNPLEWVDPFGLARCFKKPVAPDKIKLNRSGVKHVKERHVGDSPEWKGKSKWTVNNAEWKRISRDTFRDPDRVVEENGRYIYEKTYKNAIGVDLNGKPLHKVRVVTESNGDLVTAFPQSSFKELSEISRILQGGN